ncbi:MULTISPECIES: efflux RND transporter periplasmic adaptor subunit [unclassified Leifsonia]|uniref:efflux RND transporter periplasmic adaptor subunit n=1 Tax=unclassified Leifsonia TaxID=2663824 RepID=UPI0006FB864C|nr:MULTISPECIES: hypothetical protein [unclassified Leifsonia]KQX06634.1 hypothetical protein ASC59_01900 [Leifsonia sp. Root1293]KRA10918.1 hypothetical protein ASD61_01900 [Leifsonia sp. Root60]
MGVARTWVFPIIRILLVAALAVALVKIAFFPDRADATDPAQPTGSVTQPAYPVATGSITNTVTLDGSVMADAAVPLRATAAGTVDEIFISQGSPVSEGDKVYDIKVETVQDPIETTAPDGSIQITQPEPAVSFSPVYAPASGILSSLSVLHDQAVAVGDAGGQVAPPSFSVTGSLSPEQQYRLVSKPTEATVTITGGPAPFTCTGLTITTPLAGEGAGDSGVDGGADAGGGASGGPTVRCAVPGDVTVFSGLSAKISIAAGTADDVIVIPATAVKGSAGAGTVWLMADDGTTVEHPVTLGITDGVTVEVTDGLAEGDSILEFVPGAPPAVEMGPDGCTTFPDGSMECVG